MTPFVQEDDASTDDSGRILSGHAVDGEKLLIDSAGGVTTNIVAGLIMGLAGEGYYGSSQ
jgi:hypothetical protein